MKTLRNKPSETHTGHSLQKRLTDLSLTLALLLALAACAGGGGEGQSRPVVGPDDALFVNTARLTSGNSNSRDYRALKQESDEPVRVFGFWDRPPGVDYSVVTLSSPTEGTLSFPYRGGEELLLNFRITGPDADLFEFIPEVGIDIGTPQRLEAGGSQSGPDLKSKAPLDYQNPTDQDKDNIYEFTIEYTTDDPRTSDQNANLLVEITDDLAKGLTTAPPYDRDGDMITVNMDEGETLIFVMQDLNLSRADLTGLLRGVVEGVDADDVQIRITPSTVNANLYDLRLEFIHAPDVDAPADADADNLYEFAFSGALGDILPLEFKVTVLGN